jgi:hypothetical protein
MDLMYVRVNLARRAGGSCPCRRGALGPDGHRLRQAAADLVGRVAGKGLSDELKGTFHAVVETSAGRAYHVPLDARSAQTVGVGDLLSLATPPEPTRDNPRAAELRTSSTRGGPMPCGRT